MQQVLSIAAQAGPHLKAARRRMGLSQAELAARLNLAQSRVSELERHPGRMTLDQLLAMCAVLGIELLLQPRTAAAPAAAGPQSEGW